MTSLETPEKIWAYWDSLYEVFVVNTHGDPSYTPRPTAEYTRSDLIPMMLAKVRQDALREAVKACDLKLAEPWTATTTIIPHHETAEVIRRKILALIDRTAKE